MGRPSAASSMAVRRAMELSEADLQRDLDRRKPGTSRHTTQRREADQVQILSGVFEGHTTGTPIGLLIHNTDQRSKDYSEIMDRFRPGHADYTYTLKYGFRDYRGGGRSSARETAMRVAAGGIAKKYLQERHGIEIHGYLAQLGPIRVEEARLGAGGTERLLLSRRRQGGGAGDLHGCPAQGGQLDRCAHQRGGHRGARRSGRADLRPPGCGYRPRADEHQCG